MSDHPVSRASAQSRRERPVVAIDGPAGAGKSTVTRRVAEVLGYTRVDTGALYRAVAWLARQKGVSWDDRVAVAGLARQLAAPGAVDMAMTGDGTQLTVFGRDVTRDIRAQEIGQGASEVSQNAEVREALLAVQRQLGCRGGVVLEGRDIGSVVFPDAEVKFYLTASAEVRAQRRRAELLESTEPGPSFQQVLEEVVERDRRDTTRPIAPLLRADDAIEVDSSELGLEEVVSVMVDHVRRAEAQLHRGVGQ